MRDKISSSPVLSVVSKILFAPIIIFGLSKGETLVPIMINRYLMCIGVLLYAGVGIVSIFLDGMYLDYNVLSSDPSTGQHIGIILVELN